MSVEHLEVAIGHIWKKQDFLDLLQYFTDEIPVHFEGHLRRGIEVVYSMEQGNGMIILRVKEDKDSVPMA